MNQDADLLLAWGDALSSTEFYLRVMAAQHLSHAAFQRIERDADLHALALLDRAAARVAGAELEPVTSPRRRRRDEETDELLAGTAHPPAASYPTTPAVAMDEGREQTDAVGGYVGATPVMAPARALAAAHEPSWVVFDEEESPAPLDDSDDHTEEHTALNTPRTVPAHTDWDQYVTYEDHVEETLDYADGDVTLDEPADLEAVTAVAGRPPIASSAPTPAPVTRTVPEPEPDDLEAFESDLPADVETVLPTITPAAAKTATPAAPTPTAAPRAAATPAPEPARVGLSGQAARFAVDRLDDVPDDDTPTPGAPPPRVTPAPAPPRPAIKPEIAAALAAAASKRSALAERVTTGLYGSGQTGPMVRETHDPRPKSAAIQLNAKTGASKVIGLEEEEEPLEIGDAGDYGEEEPAGGSGMRIELQEYEDEPSIDEPEPEPATALRPSAPPVPAGPTRAEIAKWLAEAKASDENGQIDDGIARYSDVLDADQGSLDAFLGRGRLHLDRGDFARAVSDFLNAERIAPKDAEPQIGLGDLYFARKEYRQAVDSFEQALALNPNSAKAYSRRGISQYYRKNYPQALKDLQQAQKLDKNSPNIGTYIAMVQKKLK